MSEHTFTLSKSQGQADGDKPVYEAIPANKVLTAEVVKVEVKESPFFKDDTRPELGKRVDVNFRFQIIDQEYNGRTVFGRTPTTFSDHPDCKLYAWVQELFGVDGLPENFSFDPSDLEGLTVDVIIGNRKKKDGTIGDFVDSVKRTRELPSF